jgi:hypothetical protein
LRRFFYAQKSHIRQNSLKITSLMTPQIWLKHEK